MTFPTDRYEVKEALDVAAAVQGPPVLPWRLVAICASGAHPSIDAGPDRPWPTAERMPLRCTGARVSIGQSEAAQDGVVTKRTD